MESLNNSVLLINKPAGKTSFEIINDLKRILQIKKIGHSGTLDKFASGLLVVCTGKATKLTNYFLNDNKQYTGDIKLGATTDTNDNTGIVIEIPDAKKPDKNAIIAAAAHFTGEQMQLPPEYSALKIAGKRASDLMREGKNVVLKKRKVFIKKLDILKIDLDNSKLTIEVICSKGTYIRSLARDIGEFLGTGAYLDSLCRTKSGRFSLEDSVTIEEVKEYLKNSVCCKKFILKPENALSEYIALNISNIHRKKIFNGIAFNKEDILNFNDIKAENNPYLVLDEDKNLIAIANIDIINWSVKYLNVFNVQC